MTISNTSTPAGQQPSGPVWRNASFKNSPELNFDIPDLLLAVVDFKWLMAGHGWWIDTLRFHADSTYAKQYLNSAMTSQSAALRVCAASLLAAEQAATTALHPA